MKRLVTVLVVASALTSCRARPTVPTSECIASPNGQVAMTCEMPEWAGRSYDLFAPAGEGPFPLIFGIHGGGGNSQGALRGACPDGNLESPRCLHTMALQRGYAIVFPNGTSAKLKTSMRSWNAGGGTDDWRCTGGRACEENVDDVSYFGDLVDHVAERIPVDRERIYSTGLSNGGAMSHRLGCEFDGIAAIAPIGGAMQYTTSETCAPAEPVSVLHIHGTEDPCWVYDGGAPDCPIGQKDKQFISVEQTMRDWSDALNCSGEPTESEMPNPEDDGSRSVRRDYAGCDASLALIRMEGAGHTWPDGQPYLTEGIVGSVSRDFGNEVILDFFGSTAGR